MFFLTCAHPDHIFNGEMSWATTVVLTCAWMIHRLSVIQEFMTPSDTLKIYIDASYGVHPDGKSYTGPNATLGNANINAKSTKQKLVAKSSTETELIAASNSVSTAIHYRNFLGHKDTSFPL